MIEINTQAEEAVVNTGGHFKISKRRDPSNFTFVDNDQKMVSYTLIFTSKQ